MLLPSKSPTRLQIPFLSVAILSIGIVSSVYVYVLVDHNSKAHILDRAETIATLIPPQELVALHANESDLGSPAYSALKRSLQTVRSVNADIRFVYLIGQDASGTQFFYADSEDPASTEYSPPGQRFEEATPPMHALFVDGESRIESVSADRWGLWISGYAPVYGADGTVHALLGIDLPAYEYLTVLGVYTVLPFLVAVMLVLLIQLRERSRKKEQRALEQREEFLSIASHEVRTPLTGIRWALETLLARGASSYDARTFEIITLAHDTSVSVITRIGNLLNVQALSRGANALQKEEIIVRPFLNEIAGTLSLSAKSRDIVIAIDSDIMDDETFRADRALALQAFNNILSNAVKYSNPRTRISIAHTATPLENTFTIADQGSGISEEAQKHIFDGYYRTPDAVHSRQPGTGLGLYMTKKIVELHGGAIRVESQLGKGTTFVLSFPH